MKKRRPQAGDFLELSSHNYRHPPNRIIQFLGYTRRQDGWAVIDRHGIERQVHLVPERSIIDYTGRGKPYEKRWEWHVYKVKGA